MVKFYKAAIFLITIFYFVNLTAGDTIYIGLNGLKQIMPKSTPQILSTPQLYPFTSNSGNLSVSYAQGVFNELSRNYYISIQQDISEVITLNRNKNQSNIYNHYNSISEDLNEREYKFLVKKYYFSWLSKWFLVKLYEEKREYFRSLKNDVVYLSQLDEKNVYNFEFFEIEYKRLLQIILNSLDDLKVAELKLKTVLLIDFETELMPIEHELVIYEIDKSFHLYENANLNLEQLNTQYKVDSLALWNYREDLVPNISAGILRYDMSPAFDFTGIQVGVNFPIGAWWNRPDKNYVQEKQKELVEQRKFQEHSQQADLEQAYFELNKYFKEILFYKSIIKDNIEPLYQKTQAFAKDSVYSFNHHIKSADLYFQYRLEYIEAIFNYNSTALQVEYLIY